MAVEDLQKVTFQGVSQSGLSVPIDQIDDVSVLLAIFTDKSVKTPR